MKNRSPYISLLLFAIAMGILEAVVVVYVRELYYPDGFTFPLKLAPARIITIELIRELCTIVMLGTVAWITQGVFIRRLSVFLFLFGVWDIFYYIGLKIFLNWPESLLTWDILFFIPVGWTGPVIAPVLLSLVMISFAVSIEILFLKEKTRLFNRVNLFISSIGVLTVFFAFTYDYGMIIARGNYFSDLLNVAANAELMQKLTSFVPKRFQWEIFSAGMLFIISGFILMITHALKSGKKTSEN